MHWDIVPSVWTLKVVISVAACLLFPCQTETLGSRAELAVQSVRGLIIYLITLLISSQESLTLHAFESSLNSDNFMIVTWPFAGTLSCTSRLLPWLLVCQWLLLHWVEEAWLEHGKPSGPGQQCHECAGSTLVDFRGRWIEGRLH